VRTQLAAAVVAAIASSAIAAPAAPRRAPIDWLDPSAILYAYFDKDTGKAYEPRFYVDARIKGLLTIPMGEVRESSSGSYKPSFSLSIVDVEDLRQERSLRLVYVGLESLDKIGLFADQEECLQYEPLADRTATIGELLGLEKPSQDPKRPLARLHDLRLDRVDGILVRIPGTSNICTQESVFVITVMSPDGTCKEIGEGSATAYVCEHWIGESLRSMARMKTDPTMTPTSSCMATRGGGGCFIFDYPKAQAAPASAPSPR